MSSMLMLLLLLFVAACSEEANTIDRQEELKGSPVQLSSVTRTSTLNPEDANNYDIKIYVMSKDAPNAPYSAGNFSSTTSSTSWLNSGIRVEGGERFYMYGYMSGTYGSSITAEVSDLNKV